MKASARAYLASPHKTEIDARKGSTIGGASFHSRLSDTDTSSAKLYAASLSGSMYRPKVAGERWFENAWRAGSPRFAVFISRDALVIAV